MNKDTNNITPSMIYIMSSNNFKDNKRCNHDEEAEETEEKFDTKSEIKLKKIKLSTDENNFIKKFNKEETTFWSNLNEYEKNSYIEKFQDMKKNNIHSLIPLKFKILNSDIDNNSKTLIISKIEQFSGMSEHAGEYFKLKSWLNSLSRIPLSIYNPLPITSSAPKEKCSEFLQNIRKNLDDTVYGHEDTKQQILRIMAQWISNPDSKGNCIGIQGEMGTGKTTLVKEGICKALNMPFGFISLGGASDGSYLEGHNYTYEGSTYGKIAEILMKTKCMNPILFFDELDKVSSTYRGQEIIGILTHLTDQSQNEHYNDRYFGELELNLSKSLIVFSYNDESLINPILKDRMITINVKGYTTKDKIPIALNYLIPELFKKYNLKNDSIIFTEDIIRYIITKISSEEGVRNLKRGIDSIISAINIKQYIDTDFPIIDNLILTEKDINKYLQIPSNDNKMKDSISHMYL
jgi:ATP-dependent Lon protease